MPSFSYDAGRGYYGFEDQMASLYGVSPITSQRWGMLGSDITSEGPDEARIQADITMFENMLSETDAVTQPYKTFLIKSRLSDLRRQLAQAQAYLSSEGAMAAIQSDRARYAEMEERAQQNAMWGSQTMGGYAQPSYSQFNVSQYQPTYGEGATYQSPTGYMAPAWMLQYLTPTGEVRPLGMQAQASGLQQAALWEQGVMRGVNTIEDYLERESYIQSYGDELRARSQALAPKTYTNRSRWARALQR